MSKKKIHLICNAHIDPVWQWEWEEGAGAAVSTFRAAVEFCEENDGFVFNHNEVIVYKWVEEYAPDVFKRIQTLVENGKWHISGGWFLQPDCNMPSGESIVRQITTGRKYFYNKFKKIPTTAVNVDTFGHSRGLVQILKKCEYDSYMCMRPDQIPFSKIPQELIWTGYDDSRIMVHRIWSGYNSKMGESVEKIKRWIKENPDSKVSAVFWGVGNHGGGPSRKDIEEIACLQKEYADEYEILHSTPENYFIDLSKSAENLPVFEQDMNPVFPGCYTSQIRLKQKHRQLENSYFMTEKMLSHASITGLVEYPHEELEQALHALLTMEFHDILPGTSIQKAEEASLRGVDFGLEIAARLKARAFFALVSNEAKAEENTFPIFVYNPHPFSITKNIEAEFMLEDQHWEKDYFKPIVLRNGEVLPSQDEKESSNIGINWRKKVCFNTRLNPGSMNRFDCRMISFPRKEKCALEEQNGKIRFERENFLVEINCMTGLMDRYAIGGVDYLHAGAFEPLVIEDNSDPWRMDGANFDKIHGKFSLMDPARGSKFSGLDTKVIPSVRIVEYGDVRTVVESVLAFEDSRVVLRYYLPESGSEVKVNVRVFWNQKDKMLKLNIPTAINAASYMGQKIYGRDYMESDGSEVVSQKWSAAVNLSGNKTFAVVNDGIYGSSFKDGQIQLSLLRSCSYCAHPIEGMPLTRDDRFTERAEQGERMYNFWINGGSCDEILPVVDNLALVHNESPYVLSYFPDGTGETNSPVIEIEDKSVLCSAFFKKEDSNKSYILRLFETTGVSREIDLKFPSEQFETRILLNANEIHTFIVDFELKSVTPAVLTEF